MLPASIHKTENVHFIMRYRAQSTNTTGSTSCCGVQLRVCFGHLITNIHLCGRCIVTAFVRTGFLPFVTFDVLMWSEIYGETSYLYFPVVQFYYFNLIIISILSRSYNDVFGRSSMRIHNVSFL
jgi:hypothetical protein